MNFLKPGNVPLFSIVRYKRRDCHKLKKPEDKSSIILGKFMEEEDDEEESEEGESGGPDRLEKSHLLIRKEEEAEAR